MSDIVIQMFVFMLCTFVLGLAMGWLFWRFGSPASSEMESIVSERDFWRNNLETTRAKADLEKEAMVSVRAENKRLKEKLASARS